MVHTYSENNKYIYSVDMMMAYINIYKPKHKKYSIKDFEHNMDYQGWGNINYMYSPREVLNNPTKYADDYDRILNADLKYPIIINGKNVIDGMHRLTKAYMERKKEIRAYEFNGDLLKKFMVNKVGNFDAVMIMETHEYIELFYERFIRRKK